MHLQNFRTRQRGVGVPGEKIILSPFCCGVDVITIYSKYTESKYLVDVDFGLPGLAYYVCMLCLYVDLIKPYCFLKCKIEMPELSMN